MSLLRERLRLLKLRWIKRFWINVEPGARLQNVDDDEPDKKRKRGDDFKIEKSLDPDPPKLLQVAHGGDTVHDRAEDYRRNDHLDQIDESIAERFQAFTETRVQVANYDPDKDGDDNLDVENSVPGFFFGRVMHERNWGRNSQSQSRAREREDRRIKT
jgi:hypothetical protein